MLWGLQLSLEICSTVLPRDNQLIFLFLSRFSVSDCSCVGLEWGLVFVWYILEPFLPSELMTSGCQRMLVNNDTRKNSLDQRKRTECIHHAHLLFLSVQPLWLELRHRLDSTNTFTGCCVLKREIIPGSRTVENIHYLFQQTIEENMNFCVPSVRGPVHWYTYNTPSVISLRVSGTQHTDFTKPSHHVPVAPSRLYTKNAPVHNRSRIPGTNCVHSRKPTTKSPGKDCNLLSMPNAESSLPPRFSLKYWRLPLYVVVYWCTTRIGSSFLGPTLRFSWSETPKWSGETGRCGMGSCLTT